VAVSREVYRTGIGGMWIQFLVLFLTPFYWFTTMLFRRARVTTLGDYYEERFQSPFLGGSYAVFILLLSILGGGVGYMVAGKTMMAMTPKSMEACTPQERQRIEEYREFQALKAHAETELGAEEQQRLAVLTEKSKRGELESFVSYVKPLWFYLIYAVIVCVYTMMGGFRAAAVTDSIQGVLILVFSLILVPMGLAKIGGFTGLHASVPDYMFQLFGSATMSDYAWYTISAMALANLVSIVAVASGMQTAGSATNEMSARIGMIAGMFTKRIIMLFWALTGLLAIAIYAGQLSDPDLIWGYMTNDLLCPVAIGLVLVGVMAANMSTLDASSVSYSALFIRNIYKPLAPRKNDAHYVRVGRLAIAGTLFGGVAVALYIDNLLELFKYAISLPGIFGASIWLGFLWRRVTKTAVIAQVSACIVLFALIPNLFQELDSVRLNPRCTRETAPREVSISTRALTADVEAGLAARVGEKIEKIHIVPPAAIFFDRVARTDPKDPESPKEGLGRFNAEIWSLSLLGIDFTHLSKPQLVAVRFLFDALFPFVLLFILSLITRPVAKEAQDRFFAKLHTPVGATDEEERRTLAENLAVPSRFEREKLFPGSQWEIMKPDKMDYVGFFGSWALVGVVILLLWLMVRAGT